MASKLHSQYTHIPFLFIPHYITSYSILILYHIIFLHHLPYNRFFPSPPLSFYYTYLFSPLTHPIAYIGYMQFCITMRFRVTVGFLYTFGYTTVGFLYSVGIFYNSH